ncbi:MAG: hypothetical protein QNL70_13290 [Pseudomonas sp.]
MSGSSYVLKVYDGVQGADAEFFYAYWSFVDFNTQIYKFSISDVIAEHGLDYLKGKGRTASLGELIYYPESSCCSNGLAISVKSRNKLREVVSASKSGEHRCDLCFAKAVEEECAELVDSLSSIVAHRKLASQERPWEKLEFMEKVFLYGLAKAFRASAVGKTECEIGRDYFVSIGKGFEKEVESLTSKGYLYWEDYDDNAYEQKERCEFLSRYRRECISDSLIAKLDEIKRVDLLDGVELRIPEGFVGLYSWGKSLLHGIKCYELSVEDCERVVEYVEMTRHDEVRSRVEYAARKLNIPVLYDFALDHEMARLYRILDPKSCQKVIWRAFHQAERLVYRAQTKYGYESRYSVRHMFRQALAREVDEVESGKVVINRESSKIRSGKTVVISCLCKDVIGDVGAWDSLSTSDFVAKLIASLNIG